GKINRRRGARRIPASPVGGQKNRIGFGGEREAAGRRQRAASAAAAAQGAGSRHAAAAEVHPNIAGAGALAGEDHRLAGTALQHDRALRGRGHTQPQRQRDRHDARNAWFHKFPSLLFLFKHFSQGTSLGAWLLALYPSNWSAKAPVQRNSSIYMRFQFAGGTSEARTAQSAAIVCGCVSYSVRRSARKRERRGKFPAAPASARLHAVLMGMVLVFVAVPRVRALTLVNLHVATAKIAGGSIAVGD